jgi:hypothetical protein
MLGQVDEALPRKRYARKLHWLTLDCMYELRKFVLFSAHNMDLPRAGEELRAPISLCERRGTEQHFAEIDVEAKGGRTR